MKKIILCNIFIPIASGVLAGIIGYSIAKKRHRNHNLSGQILVDYTEDKDHPIVYLVGVDPNIFKNIQGYVTLEVIHYNRK